MFGTSPLLLNPLYLSTSSSTSVSFSSNRLSLWWKPSAPASNDTNDANGTNGTNDTTGTIDTNDTNDYTAQLWHERLGHAGADRLKRLGIIWKPGNCRECIMGKQTREPFRPNPSRSWVKLHRIYSVLSRRHLTEMLATSSRSPMNALAIAGHIRSTTNTRLQSSTSSRNGFLWSRIKRQRPSSSYSRTKKMNISAKGTSFPISYRRGFNTNRQQQIHPRPTASPNKWTEPYSTSSDLWY